VSAATIDTLPVGTVLDETYRLARLIGIGGMGAVYEGTHMQSGKRVAIKVMSRGLLAYPELQARFRREVKVTSELAHPHIVSVYGTGEARSGQPYLVMEFLEGEDLQTRLEREGAQDLSTTVAIVNQLASALTVAHAEGVVHRDLKPDNVFLVQRPDQAVFVKIVDFGISKVLKPSATKLTVARAVFGTPEFMSPEQAAGQQELIDHRSDQWSLACLAWFVLSARLPFSQGDVTATLNQVMAATPTPLGAGVPPFLPEVDKVLRRAMSKLREDRFPTIRAFARAFEAAATGAAVRPSGAGRQTEPASATPMPRPRRRGMGRWVALATLVVLAAAAWQFRDEPPVAPLWQRATKLLNGAGPRR
jgi:serine/threonine protein kinase